MKEVRVVRIRRRAESQRQSQSQDHSQSHSQSQSRSSSHSGGEKTKQADAAAAASSSSTKKDAHATGSGSQTNYSHSSTAAGPSSTSASHSFASTATTSSPDASTSTDMQTATSMTTTAPSSTYTSFLGSGANNNASSSANSSSAVQYDCYVPVLGHSAVRCVGQTHTQILHQIAPGILFALGFFALVFQWIRLARVRRRSGVLLTSSLVLYGGGAAALAFCSVGLHHENEKGGDGPEYAKILGSVTSPLLLLHLISIYLLAPRERERQAFLDKVHIAAGLGVIILNVLGSTEGSPSAIETGTNRRHLIFAEAGVLLLFYLCSLLTSMDFLMPNRTEQSQQRFFRSFALTVHQSSENEKEQKGQQSLSRWLFAFGIVTLLAHAALAFVQPPHTEDAVLAASLIVAIAYLICVAVFFSLYRTHPQPVSSPPLSSGNRDAADCEKRSRSFSSPQLPGFSRSPGGTLLLRDGRAPRRQMTSPLPASHRDAGALHPDDATLAASPRMKTASPTMARTKSKVSIVSWDRIEAMMRPDYLDRTSRTGNASADIIRKDPDDNVQRHERGASLATEASDYGTNTMSYHEATSPYNLHRMSFAIGGWHGLKHANDHRSQTPTPALTGSATPSSLKFPSGVYAVAKCLDEGEQDIPLVPEHSSASGQLGTRQGKTSHRRNSMLAQKIASPSFAAASVASPTLSASHYLKASGPSNSSPLSPMQFLRHARKTGPSRVASPPPTAATTRDNHSIGDNDEEDEDRSEGHVIFMGGRDEESKDQRTSATRTSAVVVGFASPRVASADVVRRSTSWQKAAQYASTAIKHDSPDNEYSKECKSAPASQSQSRSRSRSGKTDRSYGSRDYTASERSEELAMTRSGNLHRLTPSSSSSTTKRKGREKDGNRASCNTLLSMAPSRVGESWEEYSQQDATSDAAFNLDKILTNRRKEASEVARASSQLERSLDLRRLTRASMSYDTAPRPSTDSFSYSESSPRLKKMGSFSSSVIDRRMLELVADHARKPSLADSLDCSTLVHHQMPRSGFQSTSPGNQAQFAQTAQGSNSTAPLSIKSRDARPGEVTRDSEENAQRSHTGVKSTIRFPQRSSDQ